MEDVASLLEENVPRLLAYVRLRAGRRLLAREASVDLVQSVCREVLQDLPQRRSPSEGEFRRWLYQTAERKILDRARYWSRAKRRGAALELDAAMLRGCASLFTPSRDAIAREEVAAIERALQELPESYREVILQARILGLTHDEIAQASGKTPGAVRVLLHRALARLAVRATDTQR